MLEKLPVNSNPYTKLKNTPKAVFLLVVMSKFSGGSRAVCSSYFSAKKYLFLYFFFFFFYPCMDDGESR